MLFITSLFIDFLIIIIYISTLKSVKESSQKSVKKLLLQRRFIFYQIHELLIKMTS